MIFFDLEFYVPPKERNLPGRKGTLVFNPTISSHLLLGGHFICTSLGKNDPYFEQGFWIWDYGSEKELLTQIFNLFSTEFARVQIENAKIHNWRIKDLVTCGFGISRTDLPALFVKSEKLKIASSQELFNTFLKTKIIELSNVSTFLFPHESTLYPKSAKDVSQALFKKPEIKANGKAVWDYYDQNEYHKITSRCQSEVAQIKDVYFLIAEKLREK